MCTAKVLLYRNQPLSTVCAEVCDLISAKYQKVKDQRTTVICPRECTVSPVPLSGWASVSISVQYSLRSCGWKCFKVNTNRPNTSYRKPTRQTDHCVCVSQTCFCVSKLLKCLWSFNYLLPASWDKMPICRLTEGNLESHRHSLQISHQFTFAGAQQAMRRLVITAWVYYLTVRACVRLSFLHCFAYISITFQQSVETERLFGIINFHHLSKQKCLGQTILQAVSSSVYKTEKNHHERRRESNVQQSVILSHNQSLSYCTINVQLSAGCLAPSAC